MAAGLAMARARQLDGAGWVLLAELDPRGGDLMERLALGRSPRARFDGDLPLGARELTDLLATIEFSGGLVGGPSAARVPLLQHLVEVDGVPGVRVMLGDHLVEGATRAAAAVAPRLPGLAGAAGAAAVVIDGGWWSSGQPDRVAGADIVYGVMQASSASQNGRCRAELAALQRLLQGRNRPGRLVGVVVDPAEDPDEVRDLFLWDQDATKGSGYRVVVLGSRRDERLLAQLTRGDWRGVSAKALGPFMDLASPMGERVTSAALSGAADRPPVAVEVVDEHAYLVGIPEPVPPVVGSPESSGDPVAAEPDRHGYGSPAGETFPDPAFWPFDDGDSFIEVAPTSIVPAEFGAGWEVVASGPGLDASLMVGEDDETCRRELPPRPTHRQEGRWNGIDPELGAGATGGDGSNRPALDEWLEELSPAVRAALEAKLGDGPSVGVPRRLRGEMSQEESGS